MVTAELAVALPALVLVLLCAVTVQLVVASRAACSDAARAGARAAARGESDAVVVDTARRVQPRVRDVSVVRADGLVTVTVTARAAGLVGAIGDVDVSASAVADDEAVRALS